MSRQAKKNTHTIEWNWKSTSFWRQPNMLRELTLQDLYEKYLVMIRVIIQCCTIVCYEPETLKASHIRKIYIFSQTKTRDTCHIKKIPIMIYNRIPMLYTKYFLFIKRYVLILLLNGFWIYPCLLNIQYSGLILYNESLNNVSS